MDLADLAATQGGVLARTQLIELGVSRSRQRHQIGRGSWQGLGRHAVALHSGTVSPLGQRWAAVIGAGNGGALDGVSQLQHAGLTGFDQQRITVSITRGYHRADLAGVEVRTLRRRQPGEILPGLPRARTDIALIRAATWAASDRQAAHLLVSSAQQRLVRTSALPELVTRLRPHWRPGLIRGVVGDIADGAQALSELDFGRLCVRYRVPRPERQIVRRTSRGWFHLDAGWPSLGLAVEVDGLHHYLGMGPVDDALRQNAVVLAGDAVLRLPVLGLRLHEAELMGQVRAAYIAFSSRPG